MIRRAWPIASRLALRLIRRLKKPMVALSIEHQVKERNLPAGKDFVFRFKLIDTATGNPKSDLKDVRVLTFLSPGTWQRRDIATSR